MLQNASSLAIVAVDTEENEPIKNEVWWVRRHFWGPSKIPSRPSICCWSAVFGLVELSAIANADDAGFVDDGFLRAVIAGEGQKAT